MADSGSRSHPGLCVPENQFSPRMDTIREPWCHPYLLLWGSTLSPGNTEPQPPKCLQIALSPWCCPQPQGCASGEGFSCSQKCSPVLFTQHNSDIQGRGWVTAGTASLQHLPQVSGLTWKCTDPESGEDRHQSAPLLQPAWGPSTPTTCSPYHSHRPAPSRRQRPVFREGVSNLTQPSTQQLPPCPKHFSFHSSGLLSAPPFDRKVSGTKNYLSTFLLEKRSHQLMVNVLGYLMTVTSLTITSSFIFTVLFLLV